MLNKIIDLSLKYKVIVLAISFIISIFGYKAYLNIPIDAFPDITPKQVVIYTESPGNSAEDIEKLITYPIESALAGLNGVKLILSNSIFGLSYVSIFFEDDMDIYFLRQLVTERLNNIDIPDGWGKPKLGPNTTGLGQVFWYQIYDKDKKYSLQKIREIQDYLITPMIKTISGVEEVVSWGGYLKQYNINIDNLKLQKFNITYSDIVKSLKNSNLTTGGQYLEFNREQYLIRGIGLYKNLNNIGDTVIKYSDGKSITIKDVATLEIGSEPRFGAISIDGEEAVIGMVLQRTATNAAKVVKDIVNQLPLINKTLPDGLEIKILYDRTEITHKALDTMNSALINGVILVIIILFLFLFELRSATIVIISLPLSLLSTFLIMDWYGLSANLMSLSGLAIAIGMIVDGTIVVVENSFRKINEDSNKSKLEIISEATKEVIKPVTFAILIIIAVFIPLLTLDGLAGKLYSPMALNIVFVMLSSLVVAILPIPILIYLFLKPSKYSHTGIMIKIQNLYLSLLDLAFKYTKLLLFSISIIFIYLISILLEQGREFMPELNEESIMYRVIAIPGTALTQSVESAQNIEKYILNNYSDEVDSVLSMIGRSENGETAQANYMETLLILKPNVQNIKELGKIMSLDLKREFNYLQFVPTQPIAMRIEELLEGIKAELAIKIYGDDQKILEKISKDIQIELKNISGLKEIEVETQLGQAQIDIEPNYSALARYGISVNEIMEIIQNGIGEETVTEMITGIKKFGIVAKIQNRNNNNRDINSLKNIIIHAENGNIVTLEDVTKISVKQGSSFIKRENLSRYMVLSVEIDNIDTASFVKEANKIIENNVNLPSGYYINWAGDFKNMQETTKKLSIIIPLTLLLVFLLLYTAFNSLSKALLILLNVPFGLIGGIIAIIIADIYISVSAIIGFLAIFAIAILNGIVLITFIDELREKYQDLDLKVVIKEATSLRLRPVLMTAFTTLFGIIPLIFMTGVGSEIQYPLSIVIVGGIISSTFLTLLILPSTYLLFFKKYFILK